MPFSGRVPGGIYTDLERAAVFHDGPFLYRFNDGNYRWVALNNWNYALDFDGLAEGLQKKKKKDWP